MRKSRIAILAVLVAVPIIALQFAQNTKLESEVESLRAAAGRLSSGRRVDSGPESRPDRPERSTSGESGGKQAAEVLPADLREILARPDPMSRIRSLLAYVDGLAAADIPAALAELRKGAPEWDPEARMLSHMLLTRWAKEDPEAALASLDDLDFKSKGGEAGSILAGLAALDPKRAAAWLEDPDNALVHYPWMGHILAGTIAKEWVRQDPDAALAWAASLPDSQRSGAYSGVLGPLARTDPRRASRLAMNLEPGEARQKIIGDIAVAWARIAPQDALAWARSLEGGDQTRSTREALRGWAQGSPADAASFLDGMGGDDGADQFLAAVVGTWAPQAPAAAAEWLAGQPDGDGKNEAMGNVMWNWTTQDPAAAAGWLDDQAEGPARDAGIIGLAKAAFEFDPAGALDWATELSNQETRQGAVEIGMREWMKRDSGAARQWAGANGVPVPGEEEKVPE